MFHGIPEYRTSPYIAYSGIRTNIENKFLPRRKRAIQHFRDQIIMTIHAEYDVRRNAARQQHFISAICANNNTGESFELIHVLIKTWSCADHSHGNIMIEQTIEVADMPTGSDFIHACGR